MLILSWNCSLPPWSISRRERIPKILPAIFAAAPDIACLQEVFLASDAVSIASVLRTKGFFDFFHFKDLFIASKIKLLDRKGIVFREQGKLFSLAALDVLYGKGAQAVQFLHKGERVSLINTHLLSALANGTLIYQGAREEQVRELCELSEKLPGLGKIILGDFNFQPRTAPYDVFIRSSFIDSTTEENTTATRKLDYVFSRNIKISGARIALYDSSLSNHAALAVSIE